MDNRFIMTAFGKDRPGITADVTKLLYENGCNLEETTITPPAPVPNCSRRMSLSFQDMEDVFNIMDVLPESIESLEDAFEPFQLDFSSSIKASSAAPMKDFSSSTSMGFERSFQRRTAAAFAA